MITIAMLIALNREAELKMHLNAAFNNGVTREELKELIMHSALYCGLPAANATLHLAQQVLTSATPPGSESGFPRRRCASSGSIVFRLRAPGFAHRFWPGIAPHLPV